MTAKLLRGPEVTAALDARLAAQVAGLGRRGVTPTLSIVRVGERDDDLSYERGATSRARALGLGVRKFVLDAECSQDELMDVVGLVNADESIHGCLLFRPLPAHLDEEAACEALAAEKDVDGVTRTSLFGVLSGRELGFPPCTAEACVAVLDHYGYELSGADVVVVGRSLVVGKPVSLMLQARDATVTMCHSRTADLAAVCRRADILVVATGHAGTIGADAVRAGQAVVDVGINWDARKGRLVGDVSFEEVAAVVEGLTPVPGGVGAVTTGILCKHVVEAAARAAS